MDLELSRKVALVTGASRGLGFATARLLAQEGARVAINARNPAALEKAAAEIESSTTAEVLALPGDLAEAPIAAQVVDRAVERFGGIDILVVNTGGPPSGAFETFDDHSWQQAIDLILMSAVRLIRAALPALRRSLAPSVLTVTSFSVKQPVPNLVLSNSLRMAVIGLTKSLALELGKEGIRFNSILPAWTETARIEELMTARAQANATDTDKEIHKLALESALGRIAQPEEFAKAAAFLVSPAAAYITGVMLPVDGGVIKSTF
ncbi:MAG TPA: SDR family oxidoreductase [Anaerolineaceae bacterium]|nr:SDR family oxidoreductase [Anaerolineaceae bacterium]